MRSINYQLSDLYKRYSMALEKVSSNSIFGKSQVKKIQEWNGVPIEYEEGSILVKNSINPFEYLIEHRNQVSETIGLESGKVIWSDRRNQQAIEEYLSKLTSKYEIGEYGKLPQIYIAKKSNVISELDNKNDWSSYLMTKDWIDELLESTKNLDSSTNQDYTIEYLANQIQEMMFDHEQEYHIGLIQFPEEMFMDKAYYSSDLNEPIGDYGKFISAYDKLHSFDFDGIGLNYKFYEMFKPIGGTSQKYIKVGLYTNGTLDIQGVVGLSDCEHIKWEYGSKDYLRSLNTGNQLYEFKLSIPFNDKNSKLWWKPDEPEEIEQEEDVTQDEENEITNEDSNSNVKDENQDFIADSAESSLNNFLESHQFAIQGILQDAIAKIQPTLHEYFNTEDEEEQQQQKIKYYKEYETERFLRWFGTTHVPKFDLNSISRKTICQIPTLSNDVQGDNFFLDSNNLSNMDLTKANIMDTISLSLLSLAPKATLSISNKEDGNQYLQFKISGNQQTSNISFHLTGKMESSIQEYNHYENTLRLIRDAYVKISKGVLFLQYARMSNPRMEEIWKQLHGNQEYVPQKWIDIINHLKKLLTSTNAIDLIRFRNIDIESISNYVELFMGFDDKTKDGTRFQFVTNLGDYLKAIGVEEYVKTSILDKLPQGFDWENLYSYVMDFDTTNDNTLAQYRESINLSLETKDELMKSLIELKENQIENDYSTSIDVLKERITTFNNLIVRLPTETYQNKITSRHIFLDWKNYVDKSLEWLISNNLLFRSEEELEGKGTDRIVHKYYEYYIDYSKTIPFIDYSYCYDSEGNAIHDRWDFWSEKDFK